MTEEHSRTVGVIGLGSMGMGMARSLARNGFKVHVYDVRQETVATFVNECGGVAAASPAHVGNSAGIVMVVVVNADQTEEALFGEQGAVASMPAGSVVVTCSTVAPAYATEVGARLAEKGLLHVDAPISGGPAKAASGELSVMASGSPEAFARCDAAFRAIAAKVYRIGDQSGAGSRVKMINQLLAGVHIAAAAEAMAMGIRAGADPQVLYEVISNSAGSSWMFQNRVPHILAGDYTPLSAVNIFVKDLGIVLDVAHESRFPLPLTSAAHQMFLSAAAAGYGGEDDSAVIKTFPGIELPGSDNPE